MLLALIITLITIQVTRGGPGQDQPECGAGRLSFCTGLGATRRFAVAGPFAIPRWVLSRGGTVGGGGLACHDRVRLRRLSEGQLATAAGLFYVYTEPGSVDEAEFHDWYDYEHGPARLKVPGFRGAYRYRALDDAKPPWLALLRLDSSDVVDDPEYKALAAEASDQDKSVAADLVTLDRRIYEQLSEDGSPGRRPAPVVLGRGDGRCPQGTWPTLTAWAAAATSRCCRRGPQVAAHPQVPARPQPRRGPRTRDFLVRARAGRDPRSSRTPATGRRSSTPWRVQVVASALGARTTGVRPPQRDRLLGGHRFCTTGRPWGLYLSTGLPRTPDLS